MKKPKQKIAVILSCAVLIIIVLLSVNYYFITNHPSQKTQYSYTNWFDYSNSYCNYRLKYPYTWDIDLTNASDLVNNNCDKGSDITLTRQGYTLEFKYLNSMPVEKVQHFDSYETQKIDGNDFTKAYIDSCSQATIQNEDCTSFDTTHIALITYDNAADIPNKFASTSFYLPNGKIASLVMTVPNNSVAKNDPLYKSINSDVDKIIHSFVFPR